MKKLLFFNFSILCAAMLLTSNTMQAALGGRLTTIGRQAILRAEQQATAAAGRRAVQPAGARFTPTLPSLQCRKVCPETISPIEPQTAENIDTLEHELGEREIAQAKQALEKAITEALEKEKAIRLILERDVPQLRENLKAAQAAFNVAVTNNSKAREHEWKLSKNPEADPNQIAVAEQKIQETQLAMVEAEKTLKTASEEFNKPFDELLNVNNPALKAWQEWQALLRKYNPESEDIVSSLRYW